MARQPPPKAPNPESLALAASLWTSQISGWIPASFGASGSGTKLPDLADVLERAGEDDDRLGMGHPAIGKPKARGIGLKELEKRMLGKAKGKAREDADTIALRGHDDGGEEEESRGRLGAKKRKNTALDLLGGKKSKKGNASGQSSGAPSEPTAIPPFPLQADESTSDDSPLFSPRPAIDTADAAPSTPPRQTATSSPGGSGVFPFDGPVALESPSAQRVLSERKARLDTAQQPPAPEDDAGMSPSPVKPPDTPDTPEKAGGMSKSAQRRAKRKLLKEAKSRT